MKNRLFFQAIGMIGSCMLAVFFAVYAQDSVEGWSIFKNNTGTISMEYENPSTALKIQKNMRIDLDKQLEPSGGAVKFHNGLERDMPKQEAAWYWENFKGRHALWSYLYTNGKLIDIPASIPEGSYGKNTRIVTITNGEYFGKLQKVSDEPDAVELNIDGACCGPLIISRKMIKLMQQMK